MTKNETPTGQRTIIVTGASAGVGRATAKALVTEHGCKVFAISRNSDLLNALAKECAGSAGMLKPLPLDLAAEGAVDTVVAALGGQRLHGLLNNAGLLITKDWGGWAAEDLRRLFLLNAAIPLLLAQALTPLLSGDPCGHVVNIGSMGGFQGSVKFPGLAAYSASKAALANITECMAEELRDRLVRCNCVCLGAVDTAMLRAAFPGYSAPMGPETVGAYLAEFILNGHKLFNGKVLPLAVSTP